MVKYLDGFSETKGLMLLILFIEVTELIFLRLETSSSYSIKEPSSDLINILFSFYFLR